MTLKKIWEYLWKALFNNPDEGFSVRKTISVMLSTNLVFLTWWFTNTQNYTTVLADTYMFIGALLGIHTWAAVAKSKAEAKKQPEGVTVPPPEGGA